jgi:uncharacterized membrane protein YesL
MRLAWQAVKAAFLDFVDEIFLLALFNLLWVLSAFLVLPFPFATAGLAWVALEIGEGKAISWRTLFQGGRRYWKPAYVWVLINLVVWAITFFNLSFYGRVNTTWALLVRSVVFSMAIIWAVLQLYVFPLLIRQDTPSLKLAYRNGLILISAWPLLTIVVIVLALVLLILSSLLFK